MDYVAWPNKGYFPDNFFSTLDSWTVDLNPRKYDRAKCKPIVKVTCLNSGQQWDFVETQVGARVTFVFDGDCIIFRPAFSASGISNFKTAKNFKVEISGLVDTSGNAQQIVYEVVIACSGKSNTRQAETAATVTELETAQPQQQITEIETAEAVTEEAEIAAQPPVEEPLAAPEEITPPPQQSATAAAVTQATLPPLATPESTEFFTEEHGVFYTKIIFSP